MNPRSLAKIFVLVTCLYAVSAPTSRPALSSARPRPDIGINAVDLYVLQGEIAQRACTVVSDPDKDALKKMVAGELGTDFSVVLQKSPPDHPDILKHYLDMGKPAYLIVALVCKTHDVTSVTVTGYALAKARIGVWLHAPSAGAAKCVPHYRSADDTSTSLTCTSSTLSGSGISSDTLTSMNAALAQLSAEDWANIFGYAGTTDVYVLRTSVNAGQPCAKPVPGNADTDAVESMIASNLQSYSVNANTSPPTDILAPYVSGAKRPPANVAIATICRTQDVYTVSIAGYGFQKDSKPTSGSISGTFDGLETADWSTLFGSNVLYPTAAFLPVTNDTSNVVNPRLLHNLPLTLIATPAPAPVAPPAAGAPAQPQPPTTRLAECQASAYRMLIAGRTTTASQRTDLARLIIAGGSLKSSAPAPWGTVYAVLGTAVGVLYVPNSAEAGVTVFVCPPEKVLKSNPPAFNIGPGFDPTKALFEVGGLNAAIVGHKTSPAIGLDPYVQQGVLDTAVLDLENQLDCVITQELKKMQILNVLGNPPQLDDIATSDWCTNADPRKGYFAKLEHNPDHPIQGKDALVTQPVSSQIQ